MSASKFTKFILALIFLCSGGSACANEINSNDPLEPFNRAMFQFNEVVDRLVLKPLATLYNKIIPKPLTKGLSNFYNNIDTVPTILNDVLQANFYQAANDTWRLGINSTVGIVGLFDVAERMGLEPNAEDFGLTLARWGYTSSTYLVIPFLGPTNVRDFVGFFVNYYYLSIYPYINPPNQRYRLYFSGVLVRRADILRYESVLQQMSLDKYVFMRDAYLQHRNYLIERNSQLGDPYLGKNKLEESAAAIEESKVAEKEARTAKEPQSNSDAAKAGEKEVRTEDETKPFSDI